MCSEFGLEPAAQVFDPPPAQLARTAFNFMIYQIGAKARERAEKRAKQRAEARARAGRR